MIRVAAVGDVHVGVDSAGRLASRLAGLADHADLFLLAGDLTHRGRPEEAKVLAEELRDVGVPTVAVLGNHDYHSDQQDAVTQVLEDAGIRVLEGDAVVLEVGHRRVGIAGSKGFGGGFAGACASDFGEPEMKAFVGRTKALASRLEQALGRLHADRRIALLHYSPVAETLSGEPREIHAFLGSYLLAEAVDRVGADLVLHGHAHRGSRNGTTPGGVPVRNVAAPVIGRAYEVFQFDTEEPPA
ncbi:MAG TPA: metallophosphoesterase [Actinomycetes bacterium]|nr:metallophosphoesterase [Actinomycetes bacterium]